MSESGISDYKFEYYGYGEGGAKPFRRFETIGNDIEGNDHTTALIEIRSYYDQYRREKLNKILKKAGVATAIGISLISVITGLALGLKRKGKDMVRESKKTKWSELKRSKTVIPWYSLEKAGGEGLIVVGDNIYLVIGGVCVGVYIYRKKKNKRIL